MSTLKTYLTAVDADADSAAAVYFDKVESAVDSEGTTDVEVTDQTFSSATAKDNTTVLLLTAGSGDAIAAGSAIAVKRAFIIELGDASATLGAVLTSPAVDNLFAATTDATTACLLYTSPSPRDRG